MIRLRKLRARLRSSETDDAPPTRQAPIKSDDIAGRVVMISEADVLELDGIGKAPSSEEAKAPRFKSSLALACCAIAPRKADPTEMDLCVVM